MPKNPTQQAAYDKISALVEQFSNHIEEFKKKQQETETRIQFINPLFDALGWDMDNSKLKLPPSYRDVIHEDKVKIGGKTKAPDYCFTNHGKRLFFLEAKKPSVAIKTDTLPSYQVRRYGWSAKLPLSILTDFEEMAIYDCTRQPKESDSAAIARLKYITYDQYLSDFDWLWDTFSKEQVIKGSLDSFAKADKKGTQSVDYAFLQSLDEWRNYLATNIAVRNKDLDEEQINFLVQMNINRLVFLRNCEDRGAEPYGKLKDCLSNSKTEGAYFQNMYHLFEDADRKYNSGLFDLQKDTLSAKISIDNKVISTIVSEMYYPKSPYEFSVIGAEILGTAYERFLGKVIRLTAGHQAKVEEKPEVRKAGGVFYTPQYIVEYIVKNTVGKLIAGKSPEEIEKIKVCDPACGSGSFLLGAYQYLLDYHTDWYNKHWKKTRSSKESPLTPEGNLTTTVKKNILLNNIFGVDLDAQAVEVSKLSLLMKCMEGETAASLQTTMTFERVLPTLDHNLKSGNSLIDFDFYEGQLDFEPQAEKKVKPFNWKQAFPQVFKQGGFDVVIGNPPYVRIQTMEKKDAEYFKRFYQAAVYGNYDLYVLFIEKILKILKINGYSGVILPNKFFVAEYGLAIRELLTNGRFVSQINDFTTNQIFAGATTYTCNLFLEKRQNLVIKYHKVNLGQNVKDSLSEPFFEQIPYISLPQKWTFNEEESTNLLSKIRQNRDNLRFYSRKLFKGSSTGNDKVFLVDIVESKINTSIVHSSFLGKDIEIENEIIKPFLYGSDVRKYIIENTKKRLLFPYKLSENKIELIKNSDMAKLYPLAQRYFSSCKLELKKRKIDTTEEDFYKYSAGRSLLEYINTKILIPDMLVQNRISIDSDGIYFHGPAIHSLVLNDSIKDTNSKYFLGLLNSNLFWFFVKSTSTALSGDAYRLTPEYIDKFPVHLPTSTKTEKSAHDEIVRLVELLLKLNEDLQGEGDSRKREQLEGRIAYSEQRINELVYGLYGLTEEEIRLVEG